MVGAMVLAVAVSLALCVAGDIVGFLYQHGSFTTADTRGVTLLLLIGLPGLFAQGVSLVLTTALSGTRHIGSAIAVGLGNFVLRCALIAILFQAFGVDGIALAYSLSSIVLTGVLVVTTIRFDLWDRRAGPLLARGGGLVLAAVLSGGVFATAGSELPAIVRAVGDLLVIAVLAIVIVGYRGTVSGIKSLAVGG